MRDIFITMLFLSGMRCQSYTRFHSGRHVCTQQKAIAEPVKTLESLRQPRMQAFSEPCQKGKTCKGLRIVYGMGYKNIYQRRIRRQINYACCPGWAQDSRLSYGCNKDVNECAEKKPCEQTCTNTVGSYRCGCRLGYKLQSDGHTCTWNDGTWPFSDNNAPDVEIFAHRIGKLEKVTKSQRNELSTEISDDPTNAELLAMIETLQQKVETILRYHDERWKKVETYLTKLQYLCNRVETLENQFSWHKSCL